MIAEIALSKPLRDKVSRLHVEDRGATRSGLQLEDLAGANFIRETVKLIDETSVSELESKLPEFIQKRNQNAFILGGVLEKIRREKFWNPGSRRTQNALFEHWVEETCHYSGRKARYLISVYVGLVQAAIPSTKVLSIGWSKLRMIAPLLRPVSGQSFDVVSENRAFNDSLIKLARHKSRRKLEAALRSISPTASSLPAENKKRLAAKRFVFNVEDHDDADLVAAALERIEKTTGHRGAAALVDMANAMDIGDDAPELEHLMRKAGRDASLDTFVRLFGQPSGPQHRAVREQTASTGDIDPCTAFDDPTLR